MTIRVQRSCDAEKKQIRIWRWQLWQQEMQTKLWLSGGVSVWQDDMSLKSGGLFCVGAFDRNLASVAMEVFSHLTDFNFKKLYTCTFSAICKDVAAINCITDRMTDRQSWWDFDSDCISQIHREYFTSRRFSWNELKLLCGVHCILPGWRLETGNRLTPLCAEGMRWRETPK
jgi:hypothetical protein